MVDMGAAIDHARTGHGAYRQARRVVRAVADHRTGYIWTVPDEARDPGQIKPAALVACAVWFGLWSR